MCRKQIFRLQFGLLHRAIDDLVAYLAGVMNKDGSSRLLQIQTLSAGNGCTEKVPFLINANTSVRSLVKLSPKDIIEKSWFG